MRNAGTMESIHLSAADKSYVCNAWSGGVVAMYLCLLIKSRYMLKNKSWTTRGPLADPPGCKRWFGPRSAETS